MSGSRSGLRAEPHRRTPPFPRPVRFRGNAFAVPSFPDVQSHVSGAESRQASGSVARNEGGRMSRRWSRLRLAFLIALFLLALFPSFGPPAHASPRASGLIIANEFVQTRPAARELGALTRPSAF